MNDSLLKQSIVYTHVIIGRMTIKNVSNIIKIKAGMKKNAIKYGRI